ncbi:MAG: glycogen debranching protein GlgX [Actinomycetes bacterium]
MPPPAAAPSAARTPAVPPLGVHLTAAGATAAVLASHADGVDVVLLDAGGERVVPLPHETHGVWHGFLDGVRPGRRYGLRVHGPWEPLRGHRHNRRKLLLDPYARALEGRIRYGPEIFGHEVDDDTWRPVDGDVWQGGAARRDDRDSAGFVPCAVIVPPPVADLARQPRVPWSDTILYEAHVRGLTMRHPLVPKGIRGSYAALGHPAVLEYLTTLGVTTLELLPIHAVGDEPALVRRARHNYWGYSTLGFFAPEPRYASPAARAAGPAAVLAELSQAVDALHAAGIEVVLDVVYNHTCEGGIDGPTLSWRGLDAATYYRLDQHGRDLDVTGTGGSLDFRNPRVVQLALDSLRYWVTAFGVDGFRFDLAPTLARDANGYTADHPFLVAVRQDPVLQNVKLIAEPWDVGPYGWRTGQFPPPFAEWNDRFRDDVRTFWLSDAAAATRDGGSAGQGVRHLATRLSGSADFFGWSVSTDTAMRGPLASVNFVTAHDGFTLADLTAYETKHNHANGEHNRDGSSDNRSWNHGVEGETTDPEVLAERRRSIRNLLGTLLLSIGVPMLVAGDELGRTQRGNNNAYAIDDETTWLDWGGDQGLPSWRRDRLDTTRALVACRQRHPVLRQSRFFAGREAAPDGTTDLGWFAHDGTLMDHGRWHDGSLRTIQMLLNGHALLDARKPLDDPALLDGAAAADPATASLLLVLHAGDQPIAVRLPDEPWAASYELVWDSAYERPDDVPWESAEPAAEVALAARSMRVYRALR